MEFELYITARDQHELDITEEFYCDSGEYEYDDYMGDSNGEM